METAEVHGRDREALLQAGLGYLSRSQTDGETDAVDLFGD